jgi:hypothetical protein
MLSLPLILRTVDKCFWELNLLNIMAAKASAHVLKVGFSYFFQEQLQARNFFSVAIFFLKALVTCFGTEIMNLAIQGSGQLIRMWIQLFSAKHLPFYSSFRKEDPFTNRTNYFMAG